MKLCFKMMSCQTVGTVGRKQKCENESLRRRSNRRRALRQYISTLRISEARREVQFRLGCPMGLRWHADIPGYRSHTPWKSLLIRCHWHEKKNVRAEVNSPAFFSPSDESPWIFQCFADECDGVNPTEFRKIREITDLSSLQETVWSIYRLLLHNQRRGLIFCRDSPLWVDLSELIFAEAYIHRIDHVLVFLRLIYSYCLLRSSTRWLSSSCVFIIRIYEKNISYLQDV